MFTSVCSFTMADNITDEVFNNVLNTYCGTLEELDNFIKSFDLDENDPIICQRRNYLLTQSDLLHDINDIVNANTVQDNDTTFEKNISVDKNNQV